MLPGFASKEIVWVEESACHAITKRSAGDALRDESGELTCDEARERLIHSGLADVTRIPKQGYQWPHKEILRTFKKKLFLSLHITGRHNTTILGQKLTLVKGEKIVFALNTQCTCRRFHQLAELNKMDEIRMHFIAISLHRYFGHMAECSFHFTKNLTLVQNIIGTEKVALKLMFRSTDQHYF